MRIDQLQNAAANKCMMWLLGSSFLWGFILSSVRLFSINIIDVQAISLSKKKLPSSVPMVKSNFGRRLECIAARLAGSVPAVAVIQIVGLSLFLSLVYV